MGKKNAASASSLGNGIIKDRTKNSKGSKIFESWLHTSELNDGYDWNRINLRSVTDQSNLDDFLSTAELAGTEFTAERLNVKVIDPNQHSGLPSAQERIAISEAQKENIKFLQIPRRPKWDSSTTAEQLNQREKESFLEWRRQLALLQEKEHIVLTPFERNLDFWRQLWRVIERSDVIVQIVDARNPLLFRCEDLEKYVKEVSVEKENVILISKADLLTQAQRNVWARYFTQQGIRVAFWSAVLETERLEKMDAQNDKAGPAADGNENDYGDDDDDDDDDDNDDDDRRDESNEEEEEIDEEGGRGGVEITEEDIQSGRDLSNVQLSSHIETLGISHQSTDIPPQRTSEDSAQGAALLVMHNQSDNTEDRCKACASRKSSTAHSHTDTDLCNHSNINPVPRTSDLSAGLVQGDELTDQTSSSVNDSSVHSCRTGDGAHVDLVTSGHEVDTRPGDTAGLLPRHMESRLLTGEELLEFLKEIHVGRSKVSKDVTTVGMVGYPNVGKSSTINTLLREKKVPVSATPGRTKHFQTLYVEPTLCLCDCPGLVMPSFVSTKADMYLNGILPIDQMRDFAPPVSLLCDRVQREVLELSYGINLIKPQEGEDPYRPPTALELLNAHAYVRGFMTHKGVPDCFRSARIVLKDYVKGKLLYRLPPPDFSPEVFGSVHFPTMEEGEVKAGSKPKKSANKPMINEGGQTVKKSADKKVDDSFFAKPSIAHTKALPPRAGTQPIPGTGGVVMISKPWKKQKRGKKEKLRRVYGYLDEK